MQTFQIRKITLENAQDYVSLRQQLDCEMKFLLMEPDERTSDVLLVRNQLEDDAYVDELMMAKLLD